MRKDDFSVGLADACSGVAAEVVLQTGAGNVTLRKLVSVP